MSPTSNLFASEEEREFWRWINPEDVMDRMGVELGKMSSIPVQGEDTCAFIPNPRFKGFVSGYQNNLMRRYRAEYNFEIDRQRWYPQYPSRLNAIYLCPSKEEALLYSELNEGHCKGRKLKRCVTQGKYVFSIHDQTWFEFASAQHSMDTETINKISHLFWQGQRVEDGELQSRGKPWNRASVMEVLFLGNMVFPNKSIEDD